MNGKKNAYSLKLEALKMMSTIWYNSACPSTCAYVQFCIQEQLRVTTP